jgi:restriction system protein
LGKSGDCGIDGIIKEDKLGLDIINIQTARPSSLRLAARPAGERPD